MFSSILTPGLDRTALLHLSGLLDINLGVLLDNAVV